MPLRRFLPYDILGAGAWATMFCVLGYIFWQSFDRVLHYAEQGTLALGHDDRRHRRRIVWLVPAGCRDEEHRDAASRLDRHGSSTARCCVRWHASSGRVAAVGRSGPGCASSGTASRPASSASSSRRCWRSPPSALRFVLIGGAITLSEQTLIAGDRTRVRLGRRPAHEHWLTDVAKAVTALGSLALVGDRGRC